MKKGNPGKEGDIEEEPSNLCKLADIYVGETPRSPVISKNWTSNRAGILSPYHKGSKFGV